MSTTSPTNASLPRNPPTPSFTDDVQWITVYLVIHMLSPTSYWYAYILWFIVGCIFLVVVILHWSGARGGYIGAYWSKWAIRRRTWRGKRALARARIAGKRAQPMSLPSNGQLACLVALPIVTIMLGSLGPDYLAPQTSFFARRDQLLSRADWDISSFFQYQPKYTIDKAWWTAGSRAGILAFALTPLCVLFALKAPPFAIFAISFTTQIHFDKLSWLHRWSGRLIWLVTALHVSFWSIQLASDKRTGTNDIAYKYAWKYEKFLYGWIAFIILTAIIALSSHPLRKSHYEAFYALHILLVPMSLIMMALHHPPVWWWCWTALALWLGERLWRATWWLHLNGFFGRTDAPSTTITQRHPLPALGDIEVSPLIYPPISPYLQGQTPIPQFNYPRGDNYVPPPGYACAELVSGATVRLTYVSPGLLSWAPGQHFLINIPAVSKLTSHPFTAASICDEQAPTEAGRVVVFLVRAKSGWTKDLWDYVLHLLSNGLAHPPHEKPPGDSQLPNNGVLLRMLVDGPFGSSVRAQWRKHSTVLIIVGGSGVSFGLSVLEFVCMCLSGRDGLYLGGHSGGWGMDSFRTRRVRFVWIVREFGHLHWCSSILRRCMRLIPEPGLEVNIFVTNTTVPRQPSPLPLSSSEFGDTSAPPDSLDPPSPQFAQKARRSKRDSIESIVSGYESDTSQDIYIDRSAVTPVYGDEEYTNDLAVQENYTLDLTNFEGDNEVALPGEHALNRRVQKSGKIRRAKSRKARSKGEHQPKCPRPPSPHQYPEPIYHKHKRDESSITSNDSLLSPSWLPPSHQSKYVSADSGRDELDAAQASLSYSPAAQKLIFGDEPGRSPSPFRSQSPFLDAGDATADVTLQLNVDPREMHDVLIVSEHARPGKPRLDRIIADEVRTARGSIVVACCGPTSLSAMVRKNIAAQIDPARIWRGDMRGCIELVSEDFEY